MSCMLEQRISFQPEDDFGAGMSGCFYTKVQRGDYQGKFVGVQAPYFQPMQRNGWSSMRFGRTPVRRSAW